MLLQYTKVGSALSSPSTAPLTPNHVAQASHLQLGAWSGAAMAGNNHGLRSLAPAVAHPVLSSKLHTFFFFFYYIILLLSESSLHTVYGSYCCTQYVWKCDMLLYHNIVPWTSCSLYSLYITLLIIPISITNCSSYLNVLSSVWSLSVVQCLPLNKEMGVRTARTTHWCTHCKMWAFVSTSWNF